MKKLLVVLKGIVNSLYQNVRMSSLWNANVQLAAGAAAPPVPLQDRLVALASGHLYWGWARDTNDILKEVNEKLETVRKDPELVDILKQVLQRTSRCLDYEENGDLAIVEKLRRELC